MGAVLGFLGLNGGVNGTGAAAPALANVVNPTNAAQLGGAYAGNQQALGSQQALLQALQGQNGLGNQSQVYNQLQGVANGTGPSPAASMLNQATGANVANQAALMAGQRGAATNPALIARQAAQQGANLQQQAVGQGATMQANQSLNAISAAGNLANQQAANQIGATSANTAAQQAEQQALLGAQANVNQANVANQGNVNNANASIATNTMAQQEPALGGLANAAGPTVKQGLGLLGGAIGLAQGGQVPQSRFAQHLASGGMVKAVVSPGERIVPPGKAQQVAQGGSLSKNSEKVPGKPKHPGNDYRNDTVPRDLKEGSIVIPNSVMQSKDPVRGSAEFVRAQLAKKGRK